MKRPITSPWSAVFTSSATITLIPSARSRASSAPEISLWSVIAIAPRPTRLAVSSSVSTGVAQSGEWSVCMWRSTSTKSRSASRLRTLGAAVRRVAPRGDLRVELLEAVRRRATSRAPGERARSAPAYSPSSCRVGEQPLELGRQRERVARLEQQAELAVAQRLLVLRAAAPPPAPRRRPARAARAAAPGPMPRGRRHGDLRAREVLRLGAVARPGEAHAVAQAPRQRDRRARWPGRAARSSPASRASVGSRRSARRKSRSAPRSSSAENTISGVASPFVSGRCSRSAPGADHAVVAGEVALHAGRA